MLSATLTRTLRVLVLESLAHKLNNIGDFALKQRSDGCNLWNG